VFPEEGDRVWVNVAAFTASPRRREDQVPCDVLSVAADRVLVKTLPPYRVFTLWVNLVWVEGYAEVDDLVPA
jgi:hypothetical protein